MIGEVGEVGDTISETSSIDTPVDPWTLQLLGVEKASHGFLRDLTIFEDGEDFEYIKSLATGKNRIKPFSTLGKVINY